MTYADLLQKYQPRIITNDAEYRVALGRVDDLMREVGVHARTPEFAAILDLCAWLIMKYETA